MPSEGNGVSKPSEQSYEVSAGLAAHRRLTYLCYWLLQHCCSLLWMQHGYVAPLCTQKDQTCLPFM